MKIIFEDVTPSNLHDALELANTKENRKFITVAHGSDLRTCGGLLRLVDDNDHGWTVGQIQIQHSMFTKYRIELDNDRERKMIARLAFSLADQR